MRISAAFSGAELYGKTEQYDGQTDDHGQGVVGGLSDNDGKGEPGDHAAGTGGRDDENRARDDQCEDTGDDGDYQTRHQVLSFKVRGDQIVDQSREEFEPVEEEIATGSCCEEDAEEDQPTGKESSKDPTDKADDQRQVCGQRIGIGKDSVVDQERIDGVSEQPAGGKSAERDRQLEKAVAKERKDQRAGYHNEQNGRRILREERIGVINAVDSKNRTGKGRDIGIVIFHLGKQILRLFLQIRQTLCRSGRK